MTEKTIEKKLREKVQLMGGLALKFSSPFFTGVGDRLVMMPGGRLWFVELKSPGKDLAERQAFVKKQFEKLGFQVRGPIDSNEKLKEFLSEISSTLLSGARN
jgi:hypothetical protein